MSSTVDFSFVSGTTKIVAFLLIVFIASLFVTLLFNWGIADVLQIRIRTNDSDVKEKK